MVNRSATVGRSHCGRRPSAGLPTVMLRPPAFGRTGRRSCLRPPAFGRTGRRSCLRPPAFGRTGRRSCLRPPAFGRTGRRSCCGRRPSAGLADGQIADCGHRPSGGLADCRRTKRRSCHALPAFVSQIGSGSKDSLGRTTAAGKQAPPHVYIYRSIRSPAPSQNRSPRMATVRCATRRKSRHGRARSHVSDGAEIAPKPRSFALLASGNARRL